MLYIIFILHNYDFYPLTNISHFLHLSTPGNHSLLCFSMFHFLSFCSQVTLCSNFLSVSVLFHLAQCILWHSVSQFSCSVMSDSLQPHGLQHGRPPCPSPTARVYSNSCPLSRWCHPTISSSVVPFSGLQSFPASGSIPMSQFFVSDGQSIEVSASASVLPMKIVVTNSRIFLFFWISFFKGWIIFQHIYVCVCVCVCVYCLHLTTEPWVVSISWLLWIMLQGTWEYRYFFVVLKKPPDFESC